MKISKPAIVAVISAMVLLPTLNSCKPKADANAPFPVRFAVLAPGVGTAYLEFAKEKGVFATKGIDLQLNYCLNGGNEGNAAIASGQIDAGSYGPPVLTAIVRGLKLKIISATTDTINTGSILAGGPNIKSVNDLRGKIVATTTKGMAPYQHTFTILEQYGITAKDVKLMPANGNLGVGMLKSGQADGAILSELDLAWAQKLGFAHPLDTSGKYLGSYQQMYVFASDKLLKENFDKAQKLQEAIVEANQIAQDSFPAYFSYVRQKYGQEYDSLSLDAYLRKNLKDNSHFTIYPNAVRNYMQLMVKWEDFKQSEVDAVTNEKLFDPRFVKF